LQQHPAGKEGDVCIGQLYDKMNPPKNAISINILSELL
jgi:hypothetical protein